MNSESQQPSPLDHLATATEDAADLVKIDDNLPSTGLLSFYDRLRGRIQRTVERRGGKLASRTTEALLLVPDVFILVVRLCLDREIPKSTRALLASALAYFVLPMDFLPEVVIGAGGFLDDLILGVAVLLHVFDDQLEPYTRKYWSGDRHVREVLRDVLESAHSLVGHKVYDRLRGLLEKKGVSVDEPGPVEPTP